MTTLTDRQLAEIAARLEAAMDSMDEYGELGLPREMACLRDLGNLLGHIAALAAEQPAPEADAGAMTTLDINAIRERNAVRRRQMDEYGELNMADEYGALHDIDMLLAAVGNEAAHDGEQAESSWAQRYLKVAKRSKQYHLAAEEWAGKAQAALAALVEARAEIAVDDRLLAERKRVMDAIPECPAHGECVPHAVEWVNAAKALVTAARTVWGRANIEVSPLLHTRVYTSTLADLRALASAIDALDAPTPDDFNPAADMEAAYEADMVRRERDAVQAEVERLREILRNVVSIRADRYYTPAYPDRVSCRYCGCDYKDGEATHYYGCAWLAAQEATND
jgi:hypothetical protein